MSERAFPSPEQVWDRLDGEQQRRLIECRHDGFAVPADVVQSLASAGAIVIGVAWEGDSWGFMLTQEWTDFLDDRASDM
jgi:hypothetical protein